MELKHASLPIMHDIMFVDEIVSNSTQDDCSTHDGCAGMKLTTSVCN